MSCKRFTLSMYMYSIFTRDVVKDSPEEGAPPAKSPHTPVSTTTGQGDVRRQALEGATPLPLGNMFLSASHPTPSSRGFDLVIHYIHIHPLLTCLCSIAQRCVQQKVPAES